MEENLQDTTACIFTLFTDIKEKKLNSNNYVLKYICNSMSIANQ